MSTDYTTGTPWLCSELEGNVTLETEVSLKDDFFLAVCKDRILSIEIPPGFAAGGTVSDLSFKNITDIKNMFLGEAPQGHDALLAFNLFKLYMDWEGRNARGVQPLKELTDAIEAIGTVDELIRFLVNTPEEKLPFYFWDARSVTDFGDSEKHILAVSWKGLLLEDSAEYRELSELGRLIKKGKTELTEKMLVKLGYSKEDARKKIENCFSFEAMLAPVILTKEDMGNPDYKSRIYNVFSHEDVKQNQGKVPVLEKLAHDGYPKAERYMVLIPDFLPTLNELMTEENLPLIKDCLIVNNSIKKMASLDRECYDWGNEYINSVYGISSAMPDEDVFPSLVAGDLEWPVARLYAEKYLSKKAKDRISGLIDKLIEVYHDIINEAQFLSDATKAKAIEKLEAMGRYVVYPDSWEKYECAELNFPSKEEGGTLTQALEAIKAYNRMKSIREYDSPTDKELWPAPPTTVNCMYHLTSNNIYILGAYCQGLMYSDDMSDEEMLGRIGWVCGHEISHAFHVKGSQFDKNGNMTDWWSDEDRAAFLKRNEKMAAYYNSMHPWEGQNFKGSIMTGEACADMGSLKAILRIAKEMENFDYDALFRSLGAVWASRGNLQQAYDQLRDEHPMGYLRVNCTLQQFDEFLNFYGIKEGDGMYLAPEDRVAIW